MSETSDRAKADDWNRIAGELLREIESGGADRRARFRHAAYRVLAERLEREVEGRAQLEAAVAEEPEDADIAFDAYRLCAARDSRSRVEALERLFAILEDPEDQVAVCLELAQLKARFLDDALGAELDLAGAEQAAPESRNLALFGLVRALAAGDDVEAACALERAAAQTGDERWRAALEFERAALLVASGASPEIVSSALARVLEEPHADNASIGRVRRVAASLGLHAIEARALERAAEMALSPAPEDIPSAPPGNRWDGFIRGEGVAAAHLWLAAIVKAQALGDAPGALDAVRRARRHSTSPILASEEARLLWSLGRAKEALDALPEESASAWRSLLALAAGSDEDAAISAARTSSIPLRAALVEAADTPEREAGSIEASVADPLSWLHAHPGHPDAPALAAELLRDGEDIPYAAKLLLETCEPDAEWPTPDERSGDAPWVAAVEAVRGPYAGTPTAYLQWAARTASPSLGARLLETAARAAEDAGELTRALEIAERAAEANDGPAVMATKERLLGRLGRAADLAELLAAIPEGCSSASEAVRRHARSMLLEYRLGDFGMAADELRRAVEIDPGSRAEAASAKARLALRNADFAEAVEALEGILEGAGPDGARLHLLVGELCLFSLGRFDDAARHFERAMELGGTLGLAARLYLSAAYSVLGRSEALGALFVRLAEEGRGLVENLCVASSLETARVLGGVDGVRARLSAAAFPAPVERLWRLVSASPSELAERLRDLGAIEQTGELGDACRRAVRALESARGDFSPWETSGGGTTAPSSETSELGRAEELSREAKGAEALDVIRRAEEAFGSRPGILEARARFAHDAAEYREAADSRIRLARFFTDAAERAGHLAKAAALLLDRVGDAAEAERIAEEALECVPDHEEGNEVLTRILRARDDGAALARQVERQIAAVEESKDVEALVTLYEEQADRLLAVDDLQGAIAATEKAIEIAPSRLAAHRTRVDLLLVAERNEDAAEAMIALAEISEGHDKRSALWRAAEFVGGQLKQIDRAQAMLQTAREECDPHPTTERISAKLFHDHQRFEEEAAALERLAEMIEDKAKRGSVLREISKLALESLFDPEMSEGALTRALEIDPADLEALKMLGQSKEADDVRRLYDDAFEELRKRLDEEPLDLKQLRILREISALMEDAARAALCGGALDFFEGKPARRIGAEGPRTPNAPLGNILESIVHPDALRCPAASILHDAAEATAEAFRGSEHLPEVGRDTLLRGGESDPLVAYLTPWARVMGLSQFEVHRVGFDPRGVMPSPGEVAAVAVSEDMTDLRDTRARFFLSRGLWRAARGHGAFAEGDTVTPLRWVLALVAATLGEDTKLPLSTDMEMVVKARKALSRKLKKKIQDPCNALLSCSPHELRAWIAATSYSADRFGLLAAGDLLGVIPLIVEEAAGDAGLKLFRAHAGETVGKIPRCRELFRFALAGPFLDLERALGLSGGGGVP